MRSSMSVERFADNPMLGRREIVDGKVSPPLMLSLTLNILLFVFDFLFH